MKIIIVGAGQVGFTIASRLARENKDVVVIDADPEAVSRVSDSIDAETVVGSGSSPLVLEDAGIKGADMLLAVTNSDETNLVACLMADILSPSTKKLARVRDKDYDEYLQVFKDAAPHIEKIINPEIEVVKTIDQMLQIPSAVDVGEFADGRLRFVGIYIDKGSRLSGIRLSDLPSKINTRILISAVVRDGEMIIPRGDDRLYPKDLVYFISEEIGLESILNAFDKPFSPLKRILIVGGGRIGFRLARLMEERSVYVKLIERSPSRAAELAETMNKAVVIQGDASEQQILMEENIGDMDAVVTLTDDEENNILVSLLAKRMGVRQVITRVNKLAYFSLMPAIGLEQVVSPRLSAINSILGYIRRGKVLSARTLTDEQAEVLEAVALETSDIVGRPLRQTDIPKGALVIGIIHEGKIEIPSGNSVIHPNDRVIIFAKRQVISKIEKILTVKLEYF